MARQWDDPKPLVIIKSQIVQDGDGVKPYLGRIQAEEVTANAFRL